MDALSAVVWSDFICPWCYAGLSRTAMLESLGVRVMPKVVVVGTHWPESLPQFDRSLYEAHFALGLAIDDPEVIGRLVEQAGADPSDTAWRVEAGEGSAEVDASKEAAYDAGATGTPSWLINGTSLIAGLQEPRIYERVVSRLR